MVLLTGFSLPWAIGCAVAALGILAFFRFRKQPLDPRRARRLKKQEEAAGARPARPATEVRLKTHKFATKPVRDTPPDEPKQAS